MNGNSVSDQLPLNIQLRDDATFESFYGIEPNQALLSAIKQLIQSNEGSYLYLWGQPSSGRTHLLQAASHYATKISIASLYIPLMQSKHLPPTLLQGAEGVPLICLDDISSITGLSEWEEALFHLYNRIQAYNGRLLIASDRPPSQLTLQLLDLKSRLCAGVIYHLYPLEDEQKMHALQLRASQRGLQLPKSVATYLLNRSTRSMAELFQALDILDRASLAEKRRLTIPFVKQILSL